MELLDELIPLDWIWARSPFSIPLPGFRTLAQLETLVQAVRFGRLPQAAMQAIEAIIRVA